MMFLIEDKFTSINLFNKINLLTEKQVRLIAKGFDWTAKNYPNAVLIGGTALSHYLKNSRDLTPDIDFMIDDIQTIGDMLDSDNINYRPLLSSNGSIGITVDQFNADYLDSDAFNRNLNKLILSTYNLGIVGGYTIKIINPELLTIMKLDLGRDKDIKDGFSLITSGILNRNAYLKYLGLLKSSLNDYDSIKSYSDMIFNL